MKILQVTPTFVPSSFGGVILFYSLAKNLVRRGHEVVVYTTDIKDMYSRLPNIPGDSSIDGIKVSYFKNISNFLASKYRLSMTMGVFQAIRKDLSSFDVIHLHNVRTFQNIIIHHYAKKYGVPYVLQAHGSLPRIIEKQRLKKLYDWIWGNTILMGASRVIAVTKTEAEQYKKMGVDEDKIAIIPNGIDLTEYANLPKRGDFRRKYKIKDDEKIILYLGRIHKIKGIDLLVNAFADLVTELDNVRLVIAGPDDGFLSTLKGQIVDLKVGDTILFPGPLYERDKLRAYVDADVYVLPSVYEIFGITVLEASACGTPVIVTEMCGTADIVSRVGYVVEYDKDALRDAIFNVLSDEGLRRRFGEEGRKLVREEFGWNKVVKKLEDVYSSSIKEGY